MTPISLKSQVLPAASKALQDPLPSPPSPRLLQSPPCSCSCSHTSLPPSPPNTPDMPCPRAFSPAILAPGTCFPQRPTWFPASLSLGFYSKSATSARPSTTFPCFSLGLCPQTNIYSFFISFTVCHGPGKQDTVEWPLCSQVISLPYWQGPEFRSPLLP